MFLVIFLVIICVDRSSIFDGCIMICILWSVCMVKIFFMFVLLLVIFLIWASCLM